MNIFLKQAALEDHWKTVYVGKALGLDGQTAKEVAAEMALAGYVDALPRKPETWRNTDSGNKLAGVRPARLTRAKAEELLADLEDRAAQYNMDVSNGPRIQKVVAVGSILTEHDPIQDIDIGVQLEPAGEGVTQRPKELDALKFLKGRSAALKVHFWDDSLAHLPARVIWKA
jgi:hypothetical protein